VGEYAGDPVDHVILDAAFAQGGEDRGTVDCGGDYGRGPAVERL
jgi:hypothetical protein